jgi:hypothetical protein
MPAERSTETPEMPHDEIPAEAEKLLAVSPEDFVGARKELATLLRSEGRRDDAQAVSKVKKPSQVVLAVNRAARDRPQAAKDAASAANRLARAQLAGRPEQYRALVAEMERATGLLSEVAVATISKSGRPSDAVRRRVADHIRGALSSEETRELLARGVLVDEIEPAGFDALAGMPMPKPRSRSAAATTNRHAERERRAREKERRQAASAVRKELAEAEQRVREAIRERDELARRLDELETDSSGARE